MIEAYAIYMAIKRLSFYVTDADVTIRSDHLPLKKFLNKQTMNSKGIPGAQNLLADSLSCLIDVVSDTQQPDEPKDYEFGSYCFEELEPAKVFEKISTEVIEAQAVSSEGVECLLKSRESPEIDGVVLKYEETPLEKQQPHDAYSESSEPSQNLWISPEIGTFQFNYEEKPLKKRTLLDSSESSEFSHNSRKDTCIKITEHEDVREITLPLKPKQLQQLQKNDTYCRDIAKKLHKDVELQKIFIKENGVLYRLWTEDGRTFKCILVPQVLQDSMVILAHDHSGHNGSRRTYNCLKKHYYWPGIRKQVFRHCKRCKECILQKQGQTEKGFSHFDSPDLPMEFICMDLVGPIQPPSS